MDKDTMMQQLGSSYTNRVVDRFREFAHVPHNVIEGLVSNNLLSEDWGKNLFVLYKYLAVHVPWSIEQGQFTKGDGQFYVSAGHLQTRYGTPLYLVFEPNEIPGRQPWYLVHAGPDVSAPTLPSPPDIPVPPEIRAGAEVVMMHDHILGENSERVPFLEDTPPVARICAVAGAIQWSLNRQLQIPYWYFGTMNYLVPLYLQDREDIAKAPDVIAPVQVTATNLLVRTTLLPHMPYANARVSVKRHDQLPTWLLSAWADHAETMSEDDIEEPEGAMAS